MSGTRVNVALNATRNRSASYVLLDFPAELSKTGWNWRGAILELKVDRGHGHAYG
jgi:hypothetical protein